MSYGVAVIGTGYMAQKHCGALKSLDTLRLEDICSTAGSYPTAQAWVQTYGFKRATHSFESVLKNPQVHLVLICTPDDRHAEMTAAALQAGKHVLCEKPLGRTKKEFERVRSALKKSGTSLQIGMNCRFREQFSIPKDWSDQKKLGELRVLRGVYCVNSVEPLRRGQKGWTRTAPKGVHPFLHGGAIHCLDLLRWVGGRVRSVNAQAQGEELQGHWSKDTFVVTLEFQNGVVGELLASAGLFSPPDFHLDLWFSRGSILGKTIYQREGDHLAAQPQDIQVVQPKLDLVLEWEDFIQAIERRGDPLNSFQEALDNFHVLSAIEQSIEKRRPVAPLASKGTTWRRALTNKKN